MSVKRIVVDVLNGEAAYPPPLWMMRQAGRYLPEYRETRKKAGSFLDLCYDPDKAVEVTLQPIERFGFDASILFSDILVVPHALGRDLRFEEGHGPLMTPITAAGIAELNPETFHVNLAPVYETVRRLRKQLPSETTLIGFCGAPWTVATYMIAGRGTPDQAPARLFSYREPEAFRHLLKVLADQSAAYLIRQIEAGADVVQIFDSWSGVLDDASFEAFCVKPVAEIVRQVRSVHPTVPIIGFPKGAGINNATYRKKTGVTALGLDWTVPLSEVKAMQRDGAVQGNLDPLRLVAGGQALAEGVGNILKAVRGGPFVFNLGHGIVPETPIEHVWAMINQVRNG
ncbi:MAG: uroporphyrinogen decarboxylase [Mesorhizobium sp.]|nr:uroporphyrinogen decarboxylase [Mesorhizobium sp.]